MNVSTDARKIGPDAQAPAAESPGLAADLQRLEDAANGMPITIDRLLETLSERGNAVAILILSAPFIFIPIPGLSTAMAIVILGLSIGVIVGGKPWLPGFVRRRELSPETLHRLISGTRRLLNKVGGMVRPRMVWLAHRSQHWLIGISLIVTTIMFALPLPIPGNNIPPAIVLVSLSLGLIERDGLLVLLGHVGTVVMCLALALCAFLFWESIGSRMGAFFSHGG